MSSEKILQLLAKQMGQAASEEEIAELKKSLLAHPEYHYFIEILQAIEGERSYSGPVVQETDLVENNWSFVEKGLNEDLPDQDLQKETKVKRIFFKSWMWKAAVWLIALVTLYGSFLGQKNKNASSKQELNEPMKEVSLSYGAPKQKILPDSSIVWLNAGSSIKYEEKGFQQEREIYLEGEAYFKVKHDISHPFTVHAGNIEIKVLGTEFNVYAYKEDDRIETTLINGKIQVQIDGKPDKKIILMPHEKLTVHNELFQLTGKKIKERKELSFKVQEVAPMDKIDLFPEIAWTQNKLAFQKESFDRLAKSLERRYNVAIVFEDRSLAEEKLTGVFENETIEKALQILQMTTPFSYKIVKDTVYLRGNNKPALQKNEKE